MNNEQSKAWSAALLRAARLIQQHYGLRRALKRTETIEQVAFLNKRKADGRLRPGEDALLAQLEATE